MKQIKKFTLLICLIILSTQFSAFSQSNSRLNKIKKECVNIPKHIKMLQDEAMPNSEMLYIGNKLYSISKSLVSNFDDYKNIFPFATTAEINSVGYRMHYDKPYHLIWELINDTLYLTELGIQFVKPEYIKNDTAYFIAIATDYYANHKMFGAFEIFEKFTGRKFIKPNDKGFKKPRYSFQDGEMGIMKADWVNGNYLLKKWKIKRARQILVAKYLVEFKDGVMISKTKL